MSKKAIPIFLGLSIAVAFLSGDAMACACCAETGTYHFKSIRPDAYYLDVVREMQFANAANLYETEAGTDLIKGLGGVLGELETGDHVMPMDFDLKNATFASNRWNFVFRSPKGESGSLTLPLPPRMVEFKVDIHDGSDKGLGPLLYKEFRFQGSVASASGFMRAGVVRGTRYFLVFQGRGRGCNDVSDFTHWRLAIDGPKASYAFFGELESGRKPEAETASPALDTPASK
ncbi:MAG: hypothetical protein AB7V18_19010 [Pyrinomonadaceae bacterium]